MEKELILFVPGLSSRTPAKYSSALVRNLSNEASKNAGSFRIAGDGAVGSSPDGAAGGAVAYEYSSGPDVPEPKIIVFREVVWGDIPRRLSELSAFQKFWQGFVLLFWGFSSFFLHIRAAMANKYQWAALL